MPTPDHPRELNVPLTIERLSGEDALLASARLELPVSVASDAVIIDPWEGPVRLSMDPSAVDLAAASARGIPVMEMHQRGLPIGRIVAPVLDGGKLRGTLRFSQSTRGQELYRDAQDGILTDLSVGAVIQTVSQQPDHLLAVRWTPREVSLVDTGADQSVGINRSQQPIGVTSMTTPANQTAAADSGSAASQSSAPAAPSANQNDINIMELARYLDGRAPELQIMRDAQDAIAFGRQFETFRSEAWGKLEAHKKANPVPAVGVPQTTEIGLSRKEAQQFSIARAVQAVLDRDWRAAEFELEASRAVAKRLGKQPRGFYVPLEVQREMAAGSSTSGGALIATDLRADLFIEALRAQSLALNLGVRTLPGLVGDLDIPKQTGSSTFYWIREGRAPGMSEMAFGAISMTPRTLAGAVPMTRKLLMQSAMSIESMVRQDMLDGAALALDQAIFSGDGVAQPLGVLNHPDINTVNFTTDGAPTWAEVVQMETEIATDHAMRPNPAYVVTPTVMGNLKTTKKDAGSGIFLTDGQTLNGYPVRSSDNQAVSTTMVFGCWSQVMVGFWGVLDVKPDEATEAATGTIILRLFQDVDLAVRNGQSFCKGT